MLHVGTTEGGNDCEGANSDGLKNNCSDFYAMARTFQAIDPDDLVSEFSALLPQTEKVLCNRACSISTCALF